MVPGHLKYFKTRRARQYWHHVRHRDWLGGVISDSPPALKAAGRTAHHRQRIVITGRLRPEQGRPYIAGILHKKSLGAAVRIP